jgi:predicted transcriptional regulator
LADGEEMKKTTLEMPQSLHRRMKHFSADSGKSLKKIATEALAEYLDKHRVEKK